MDSTLFQSLSVSNGFVAIAFVLALWALRKFVKTVYDLAAFVRALDARVTHVEYHTGVKGDRRERAVRALDLPFPEV
jgi:hypothetical protein